MAIRLQARYREASRAPKTPAQELQVHSRHAFPFNALLYALMDPSKEAYRNRRLPRADRTAAPAVHEGALCSSAMGHLLF